MKKVEYLVLAVPGRVDTIHVEPMFTRYALTLEGRRVKEFGRVCALNMNAALALAIERFGPTVKNAK